MSSKVKAKQKKTSSYFPKPTKVNKKVIAEAFNEMQEKHAALDSVDFGIKDGDISITSHPLRHDAGSLVSSGKYFYPTEQTSLLETVEAYKAWLESIECYSLKEMTLTFACGDFYQESPRHCLTILKPEGKLHAGLRNLPGGRVNPNESPGVAALRELKEETGYTGSFPQLRGIILPSEWGWAGPINSTPFIVYIFSCLISKQDVPEKTENIAAHAPAWTLIQDMFNLMDNKFLPNLGLISTLISQNVGRFIVQDSKWPESGSINASQCIVTLLPMTDSPKERRRFET
jgi:8-oxo-dGTP pyrophosphatase MutT (NUDIX family)